MGACAPTPFSFGVVSPTSWAFSSCTHGKVETEIGKGDAHPQLPFPPGCFGERRKAGNCSRGCPASLDPSLLLLTPEAFSQPSLLEAAGGLWCPGQLLLPCASRELRHPCQWRSPKPPLSAGHWERKQAKVEGMERGGGCGCAGPGVWCTGRQPREAALGHCQAQFVMSGLSLCKARLSSLVYAATGV